MNSLCLKTNNENEINFFSNKLSLHNYLFDIKKFKKYTNIIIHPYSNSKALQIDEFKANISKIIMEDIQKNHKYKIVDSLFTKEFFYFTKQDKTIIFREFQLIDNKLKFNEELVLTPLHDFLQEHHSINILGFINFRLTEYKKHLKTELQASVNQYIIDKEYVKYVSLLKDYVSTNQNSKLKVNLLYINQRGILLDENYKYIELEELNTHYISDISFSQNDFILNTLIGILPSKITLHLLSQEDEFIQTLRLIFGKRINKCRKCELCNSLKKLL